MLQLILTSVKLAFPLGSTKMGFKLSMRSACPLAWKPNAEELKKGYINTYNNEYIISWLSTYSPEFQHFLH